MSYEDDLLHEIPRKFEKIVEETAVDTAFHTLDLITDGYPLPTKDTSYMQGAWAIYLGDTEKARGSIDPGRALAPDLAGVLPLETRIQFMAPYTAVQERGYIETKKGRVELTGRKPGTGAGFLRKISEGSLPQEIRDFFFERLDEKIGGI